MSNWCSFPAMKRSQMEQPFAHGMSTWTIWHAVVHSKEGVQTWESLTTAIL